MNTKINLNSLGYQELENFVTKELLLPKYRTAQLWNWIWAKNCTDFESMSDIAKKQGNACRKKPIYFALLSKKSAKARTARQNSCSGLKTENSLKPSLFRA